MNFNQPVPELPVADVEKAQQYYRDVFGCKIEWLHSNREMGAVSSGEAALFFRKTEGQIMPSVNWIYAEDVDALYQKLKESGANIVDEIEDKPWRHRQFTVKDLDGNLFHIHHELY